MIRYIKEEQHLDPEYPFSIYTQQLKKSDSTGERFHWHPCFEITMCLEGTAHYFVSDKVFEIRKGDLIIFNNMEPHSWKIDSDTVDLLVSVFDPAFIGSDPKVKDDPYMNALMQRGSSFRNKLDSADPETGRIGNILRELFRENERKQSGYRLVSRSLVIQMLAYLTRSFQGEGRSAASLLEKQKRMDRLTEAVNYINTHFMDEISLEQLAEIAFMSPNYFSSYFKKATGQSYSKYLNYVRISNAHRLIVDSRMSVLDAAEASGFRNMSNFYRVYRAFYGAPPRQIHNKQ